MCRLCYYRACGADTGTFGAEASASRELRAQQRMGIPGSGRRGRGTERPVPGTAGTRAASEGATGVGELRGPRCGGARVQQQRLSAAAGDRGCGEDGRGSEEPRGTGLDCPRFKLGQKGPSLKRPSPCNKPAKGRLLPAAHLTEEAGTKGRGGGNDHPPHTPLTTLRSWQSKQRQLTALRGTVTLMHGNPPLDGRGGCLQNRRGVGEMTNCLEKSNPAAGRMRCIITQFPPRHDKKTPRELGGPVSP